MLFEAALLSTSFALGVSQVIHLPHAAPQVAVAMPAEPAASDPTATIPQGTMSTLEQLAVLPSRELASFVEAHADVVAQLLSAPPTPADVSMWWSGLGIEVRSTFLDTAPQVVGNLEGVPFSLRDYANRQVLARTTETLAMSTGVGQSVSASGGVATGAAAAATGRSHLIDAGGTAHLLDQVREALVSPAGQPRRQLVSLDPSGAGTASIVIGDLDTADYVSYLVPGMFYTVDSQMTAWATAAQSLHQSQLDWITTLGMQASVATVAWLGYETPSMVNFTSLDLAYEGRDAIADAITGLRTLRGAQQPHLALVAHSYGSTAAMMALADYGLEVDALVLVGSPGSEATTAAQLGVVGDNVYVGEADWDQSKDSAFFGADPGSAAFGAEHFSVDGGVDPIDGSTLLGSTGHDAYFVAGSESLRNIALVALGRGYLVTTDGAGSLAPKGTSGLHGAGG